MARVYSAAQFEQDYLPKRLGNWQQASAAAEHKSGNAATRYSTLPAPKKRSSTFIADANGHLLQGVRRLSNSFHPRLTLADAAPTRWPKPSLTIRAAPAATMGYKGLPLATSTPTCGASYFAGVVATRLPHRPAGTAAQQGSAAAPAGKAGAPAPAPADE